MNVEVKLRSLRPGITKRATRWVILGAMLCLCCGCKQSHQGWEPPLEETSTGFLQTQVETALRYLRDAQGDLPADPGRARERLDGAVQALQRMSGYYLPLLEARERAYDAHRFLYYGQTRRARTEIETVEEILDAVAEAGGDQLAPAMKKALDLVSEAKAATMESSDNAPELIKSLAIELNYMALKGELELPEGWPPPAPRNG